MGVETEMYRVEELHPLRVGVIEDFANSIQPDLQLVVFFDYVSLVAPVGSEPLLFYIVYIICRLSTLIFYVQFIINVWLLSCFMAKVLGLQA